MTRAFARHARSNDRPQEPHHEAANDADWRAQADEGGCADWGISWAFHPAPPAEPLTRWHALAGVITLAAIASTILVALTDAGAITWGAR